MSKVPTKKVEDNLTNVDAFTQAQAGTPDRNQAALSALKMDVETQALIRAIEDLLSLTRQMKELWLFGQLDTLGKSGMVQQTEQDAVAVTKLVASLTSRGKLYGDLENSATYSGFQDDRE